jgi:hypothetical protein
MTELGSEIDSLSVSLPAGSNRLILYDGWNGDAPMWQITESAANSGQGYYYISQTEAGSGCCRSIKDCIIKHRKNTIAITTLSFIHAKKREPQPTLLR